jgi:hypothetical protein
MAIAGLALGLALVGPPTSGATAEPWPPRPGTAILPHAAVELGVLVRDAELDAPGIAVTTPPAVAVGLGFGLVIARPDARARGFVDAQLQSSRHARAIETLADMSSRTRPVRSQAMRVGTGAVWTIAGERADVGLGVGLGYALRALTSPVDERIPAQLIHAPRVLVPIEVARAGGRVTLRLRPSLGPSVAAAALADRTRSRIGLGLALGLDLDVRVVGPLVVRVAVREDHDLFFPRYDGQHALTLALVFAPVSTR